MDDKLSTFCINGPHCLVEDCQLPVAPLCAHVPPKDNNDIIILSSSTLQSKASSHKSSDVFASSPQLAAQVLRKRKTHIDSSLPPSDDNDLYVADSKLKRSKVMGGSQKVVAVKSEWKGKDASVKGKGKGKEIGRQVLTRWLKKSVTSVAFIEDEDSSSSDDKPPPVTRPKPKPAYCGTANLQGSIPDSAEKQKDVALTPGGKDTAQHMTIPAVPLTQHPSLSPSHLHL
jgi:hypothetical protein